MLVSFRVWIIRVVGAVLGIGLIHYAFIFEHPETGFYGLMILALPGICPAGTGASVFSAIGAIALFSAIGYGDRRRDHIFFWPRPSCINLMLMSFLA